MIFIWKHLHAKKKKSLIYLAQNHILRFQISVFAFLSNTIKTCKEKINHHRLHARTYTTHTVCVHLGCGSDIVLADENSLNFQTYIMFQSDRCSNFFNPPLTWGTVSGFNML